MPYTRKTRDVYYFLVNYGAHGWEHETTESSLQDAIAQKRCYRENCPEYPTRIVRKREKLCTSTTTT
jgi:hypothetical protein